MHDILTDEQLEELESLVTQINDVEVINLIATIRHYKADTKEWMERAERITTMGIELQQENARLREENEHCTKLLKHAIKINENNLCSFCCQALATETDGDKS